MRRFFIVLVILSLMVFSTGCILDFLGNSSTSGNSKSGAVVSGSKSSGGTSAGKSTVGSSATAGDDTAKLISDLDELGKVLSSLDQASDNEIEVPTPGK